MFRVLFTWTAALALLVEVALPSAHTATAKSMRAGGGAIELSSQQKPGAVTVKKKVIQKKIGAKATRPSPKLNPQPEPPMPAGRMR